MYLLLPPYAHTKIMPIPIFFNVHTPTFNDYPYNMYMDKNCEGMNAQTNLGSIQENLVFFNYCIQLWKNVPHLISQGGFGSRRTQPVSLVGNNLLIQLYYFRFPVCLEVLQHYLFPMCKAYMVSPGLWSLIWYCYVKKLPHKNEYLKFKNSQLHHLVLTLFLLVIYVIQFKNLPSP